MAKYKTNTTEVNAVRYTGDNADAILGFCDSATVGINKTVICIETPNNTVYLGVGDWIVKIDKFYYGYSDNEFKQLYTIVHPPPAIERIREFCTEIEHARATKDTLLVAESERSALIYVLSLWLDGHSDAKYCARVLAHFFPGFSGGG